MIRHLEQMGYVDHYKVTPNPFGIDRDSWVKNDILAKDIIHIMSKKPKKKGGKKC